MASIHSLSTTDSTDYLLYLQELEQQQTAELLTSSAKNETTSLSIQQTDTFTN